ncbi:MAG: M42 family peptidase [Clostridia bacterium]|nr:M42 family peptidase [Clostridia bacterium]
MNKNLLYDLLDTVSVSGCEEANQRIALDYAKDFAEKQFTDAVGNAVSVVNPDATCRVLLCAHMDEIGFRVTHITGDGMIRVQRAGGVKSGLYVGSPMQIIHERTENGRVIREKVAGVGIITESLLKKDKVDASDLMIDIGANSREEAEAVVAIGDPVCADCGRRELLNGRISARALDDKSGAFVILEAAKKAAESGVQCGIYANTSVGEETSGRGAYFAGSNVEPTCAIVVDVTWASDSPERDADESGDIRLGGGPVLCLSGMVNKRMNALLEQIAKENGIGIQYEVAGGRTYTDGDTLLETGRGVPMALVSIPLRYMHSSVEVADWNDIKGCIDLIAEFLMRVDEGFDFRPIAP